MVCLKKNISKGNSKKIFYRNYKLFNQSDFENDLQAQLATLKCNRIRSFSGQYFPTCGLNTERYGVSLRVQSECGKYRPEKLLIRTLFAQWLAELKDPHYSRFEEVFLKTLNNAVPVKIKILRYKHNPFMSKSLKEAIMVLSKLKNKFNRKITAEILSNSEKLL